jgi:hypothetical protein
VGMSKYCPERRLMRFRVDMFLVRRPEVRRRLTADSSESQESSSEYSEGVSDSWRLYKYRACSVGGD